MSSQKTFAEERTADSAEDSTPALETAKEEAWQKMHEAIMACAKVLGEDPIYVARKWIRKNL